ARAALQSAWEARGDNDLQLITFARDARAVPLDPDAEQVPAELARHGEDAGAGSNLEAALQLAYGLYPPGHLRRAVLLSDGGQTEGDLLTEADRARRFGVTLHVRPYREGVPREVAVRDLVIPD